MTQVVDDSARRGTLLDLIITNRDGLAGNMKVESSLGCSDHKMLKFKIL